MLETEKKLYAKRGIILQTEAEFHAELSRLYRDNGRLAQSRERQVLSSYYSRRARADLFRLLGVEAF